MSTISGNKQEILYQSYFHGDEYQYLQVLAKSPNYIIADLLQGSIEPYSNERRAITAFSFFHISRDVTTILEFACQAGCQKLVKEILESNHTFHPNFIPYITIATPETLSLLLDSQKIKICIYCFAKALTHATPENLRLLLTKRDTIKASWLINIFKFEAYGNVFPRPGITEVLLNVFSVEAFTLKMKEYIATIHPHLKDRMM